MTNQERAADVIYSHMSSWDDEVQAMNATQDLVDAGLLISDPPEPKWPGFWEVDGLEINLVDKDGEVLVERVEEAYETCYGNQTRPLWLNRQQVLAIVAAAKLEEEQE